jgi:putative ABC transport system permease protein
MLVQDVRYALRQLRRSPGFACAAVLTLALGLGASSAIFCLIDGLWLHPLRVPHSGELVRMFSTTQQDPNGLFSYSEYQTMAERATALKSVVALGRRGSLMPRADGTLLLLTNVVSSNFFEALGVEPMLGRVFAQKDAAEMRSRPGVLLGYGCWKRVFAGDPHIVGREITLQRGEHGRNTVTIWGVLPPSFREIDNGLDRDLWVPAESWAAINGGSDLTSHEFRWFNVLGRLAPGASVTQANEQVAAIAKALETADPATNHGRGARAISDFSYRMEQAGTTGLVLFAIVEGVVLLGTLNLAQLLFARALARAPEVALRLSLGARRLVVARQLVVENLLLGALGLAAGLVLAAAIAAALPRLLVLGPEMLNPTPSTFGFNIDWRVFLFASTLALVTILLLAFVPLSQVARMELVPALQTGSATRTEAKTPLVRRAAIWLQIAVSFALLVSTGAMVRSFVNTRTQDIGLTRNQVLVAFTQDPDAPMRDAVLAKLRALPGVQSAEYAIRSPLMPSEGGIVVKALLPSHPELRDPIEIKFNAVSSNFLATIGTRVVRGRGFAASDKANGPPVVLVNQTMAEKYWPGRDPSGQVVRILSFAGNSSGNSTLDARVVGVTQDAPINQVGELPEPYLYIPFDQYAATPGSMGEITFVIQTGQNAMSMAQDARQVFIHANPLLDPMFITSLPELIRSSSSSYQMMAELVTVLGFIGLALTVVGLYGFLAFRVARRRREIGIRMALGASREATALLVVRETLWLAAAGLALGVALALGAARLESSMLFGVQPLNAISIAAALAILLAAVAAAAWLPARRAARVDPMQALRTE